MADYSYDMAPDVAVKQVLNTIKFPTTISADLDLSSRGSFGTTLSWQSSDPAVISNSGKVNRQSERSNVTLTLTATKGKARLEQKYELIVRALGADDNDDVDEALAVAVNELKVYTETISDLTLPESKQPGVEFSYQSSDGSVLFAEGKVNRPAAGAADKTVKLTLIAKKGSVTKSVEQEVLIYAKSNTSSPEGKIREAYLASRTSYLHNRNLDGYWEVFAAYSVLGDYVNQANGYRLTLPEPTVKWYGTQYGAMVMGIVAAGENPYNYRGCDWVKLLNENYGGMYAAGLYSSLGMAAAGADPAVYNSHRDDAGGASLTQDRAMGLDIAGWAAVVLAGSLDTGDDYLTYLKDDFMNHLLNVATVGKDGNFAGANGISTNCVLLGLNALYWAGVEEAYPLADSWRHSESGVSIVDVCYNANWGSNSEFGNYSGQAVLTFGDLYTVLYKGGNPAWLDIALTRDKLDAQIARAENLLAQADKYTEESISTLKAALAAVKAIPTERLNADLVSWGREYFDLYDAVRFAEEL